MPVPRDFDIFAPPSSDEAVHVDVVGHLAAGELQHRRPEQRVEVDDVLADEVNLLDVRRGEEFLEAAQLALRARLAAVEVVLERGEIADRRIEPHVEVFAGRVRNRDAEVRRIARDVPVAERLVAAAAQPFARLVGDRRLQPSRRVEPALQELDALRIGELEEVVIGRLAHRRLAPDSVE